MTEVVIGRDRRGSRVSIDLVEPAHVLIQGQTRSGKSTVCYRMLAALIRDPRVLVCGCDPSGVLLGPMAHRPGASLRSLTNRRPEAHVEVLESLVALMHERIDLLLAERSDAVRTYSEDRPLLVAVLEELPGLLGALDADDARSGRRGASRLGARAQSAVRRLVMEGAKCGLRLVVLCQRADASLLGGDVRSNFASRFSFRVDSREAVAMLHPQAPDSVVEGARHLRPGQALLETRDRALGWVEIDSFSYDAFVAQVGVLDG